MIEGAFVLALTDFSFYSVIRSFSWMIIICGISKSQLFYITLIWWWMDNRTFMTVQTYFSKFVL